MFQFTFIFSSTWKIIIKGFRPVLDILHSSFDDAFLKWRMQMMSEFQKLASLRIPTATISVEIGYLPNSSTKDSINRSAISIVLSKDISIWRICLLTDSIATHHNQTYLEPTLIKVSSIINSCNFPFLCNYFFGIIFLNPFPDRNMAFMDKPL